ncbi:MAG: hypothetical protein OQJ96_12560 [Flavobacteriales bacterium]|nr:hypothetical protein [Flavobacteriales bacterium]MCW8912850.1 hypothetical protein [Flavobacteriales bacterium]MCW8937199.1 hypothetical protein [Flavobacteriales bacterium]MCW8941439.1 hypothetical protein [Flavobacteriales bacterium]MCW8968635.1 hypothetical protein [Flavobacteriales bacterium]
MKKLFLILFLLPALTFAQTARDINLVIQKTLDLEVLKKHYNGDEMSGQTPILIINDDKIPNNLIVFKFNKRVKVMTFEEIDTFKNIYQGSLDSYFIFEVIHFEGDNVIIKANFRKANPLKIEVTMQKKDKDWIVTSSSAE